MPPLLDFLYGPVSLCCSGQQNLATNLGSSWTILNHHVEPLVGLSHRHVLMEAFAARRDSPHDEIMKKLRKSPWTCCLVLIWCCPVLICAAVNLFYQWAAFFPNRTYLEWAETATQCKDHLPDIFLDLHKQNNSVVQNTMDTLPGNAQGGWLSQLADTVPLVALVTAVFLCVITKDLEAWAIAIHNQTLLIFLNAICEASTVIPSSYGYERCKDYLGIEEASEYTAGFNFTGSCVAMIWSGHTIHTMIGVYASCTVLARHFGCSFLRSSFCGVAEYRTIFMWIAAGVLAVLLLLDKGHYTVDIQLAVIIGTLTLTHESLQVLMSEMFIRQAVKAAGLESEYSMLQHDH